MITPDMARRARIAVRCPHCSAAQGTPCTVLSSGKPLKHGTCHPSRVDEMTRQYRDAA